MTSARSCTVEVLHQAGVPYPLPPYGAETRYGRPRRPSRRCHDCGVEPGAFHHIGCDLAQCPACRGQMFGCGCCFDEDGQNGEDDWDE